ncbi:protein bric-a-brac 2-like [Artemia franciscana]|uniref:protein bric-a-brac 2-like n=1 Tax=Artemia franciscana TaxID=6661 RepID=UPI0032DB1071
MVFYAMEQDEFCLKWTNYSNAYKGNFAALLNNEHFTDVTLSCENQNIKCHRLVLSACSSYFENLLISHSDSHPIIILKDIKFCDMQALVKFVYTGEVTVAQAQVKSLLSLADMLKVTGLTESGESSNKAKNTIYLVEGTEVSEASPSMERRRQDRDSEKDAFMHDSLMDSVSPIPPCTTGILLNNTNEIRPCSSVAQQNDVITVKSELTSEETAVSMSQFVNSCQDHSEGAGTPSLFIDNAASFNCSNVVKSEVITDPCEETTGPMSNFVYNLQDYGEEAGTSVLSDDNIANFDFPGVS